MRIIASSLDMTEIEIGNGENLKDCERIIRNFLPKGKNLKKWEYSGGLKIKTTDEKEVFWVLPAEK